MWLFLDLLAGESLVVLMASLFPNFVVALALTAFANGLWMSVGGFLVSPTILNPFWRFVFHYIDYVCFFLSFFLSFFVFSSYPLPHFSKVLLKSLSSSNKQQAYVFRGMMVNEFGGSRVYDCGPDCECMYVTSLASRCQIDGKGVLAQYGYRTGNEGKWVGIMLVILLGYRLIAWGVVAVKKS